MAVAARQQALDPPPLPIPQCIAAHRWSTLRTNIIQHANPIEDTLKYDCMTGLELSECESDLLGPSTCHLILRYLHIETPSS